MLLDWEKIREVLEEEDLQGKEIEALLIILFELLFVGRELT